MLYLGIAFIGFMFISGVFDALHNNYVNSDEYRNVQDNYLADVRRIENMM